MLGTGSTNGGVLGVRGASLPLVHAYLLRRAEGMTHSHITIGMGRGYAWGGQIEGFPLDGARVSCVVKLAARFIVYHFAGWFAVCYSSPLVHPTSIIISCTLLCIATTKSCDNVFGAQCTGTATCMSCLSESSCRLAHRVVAA